LARFASAFGWEGVQWFIAGWSSPVARQAHNLKVIGSNPIPATKIDPVDQGAYALSAGFFHVAGFFMWQRPLRTAAARFQPLPMVSDDPASVPICSRILHVTCLAHATIEFQTGAHGHPFDDKFYQKFAQFNHF
jgi:hypothetical protein